MNETNFVERRKAENTSLSLLIDRVVELLNSTGESKARFLLMANQVPATVGARILCYADHRQNARGHEV